MTKNLSRPRNVLFTSWYNLDMRFYASQLQKHIIDMKRLEAQIYKKGNVLTNKFPPEIVLMILDYIRWNTTPKYVNSTHKISGSLKSALKRARLRLASQL